MGSGRAEYDAIAVTRSSPRQRYGFGDAYLPCERGRQPPPDFALAEALSPFTDEEAARLRRYVELAEQLKGSGFFQQGKAKFEIKSTPEGMSSELSHREDEEAVTVMVARLRKIHTEGRSGTASFPRTLKTLRRHTEERANASADWFREVLDSREEDVKLVLSTSLIGLVVEHRDDEGNLVKSVPLEPDQPFWDWVYGVYLHDDEEKLARVKYWTPMGAHRFNFLQMAWDLTRVYYGFTGIVREVLEEPALVSTATDT
jgi:hypothetical protein